MGSAAIVWEGAESFSFVFAGDLLLFCKVNLGQSNIVIDILNKFFLLLGTEGEQR